MIPVRPPPCMQLRARYAASLETCNFAPIYLACVLASCLLAPLTVSRHRHAGPRSPHHHPLPHRHHAERALGVGQTVKYLLGPSAWPSRCMQLCGSLVCPLFFLSFAASVRPNEDTHLSLKMTRITHPWCRESEHESSWLFVLSCVFAHSDSPAGQPRRAKREAPVVLTGVERRGRAQDTRESGDRSQRESERCV